MTNIKQGRAARSGRKPTHASVGDGQTDKGRTDAKARAQWHEQLAEDRTGQADPDALGSHSGGATRSANSASADPFVRKKALGEPVPQVTRHI